MKYFSFFLFCYSCLFQPIFAGKDPIRYTYGSGNISPAKGIEEPIQRIQIFGERCSGTTFLEQLLRENLETLSPAYHYGVKHFPCWFDYPFDENQYKRPLSHYTLEGNEDVLFIIIFRNPYDWLRSFHTIPHKGTKEMRSMNFHDFIRSPWLVQESAKLPWVYPIEQNPKTGKPFENVMKLRTARIQNMLRIKDLAKHVYFINYETLKNHQEEVLKEINAIFGIELKEMFVPIDNYKGKDDRGKYEGSHYPAISQEDGKFINQNLDKKLEKKIGYELVKKVPAI